jgi:hypothetical protein
MYLSDVYCDPPFIQRADCLDDVLQRAALDVSVQAWRETQLTASDQWCIVCYEGVLHASEPALDMSGICTENAVD